jgi:O-Antigen ligase
VDVVEALVLAMFLVVPVCASSLFWDQFTTVKWYALHALAILLLLAQLRRYPSRPLPDLLKKLWLPMSALAALAVYNCVRSGLAVAMQPLLERFTFVTVALCLFGYLQRNQGDTDRIGIAVGAATVLVDAYGLAQELGFRPLPPLTAGDQRSSFFGNVNLAAQFLGFATLFLLSLRTRGAAGRPGRALALEAVLVATFVYLYLLRCRSVFLALAAAAALWLVKRPDAKWVLARTLPAAALIAFLLFRGAVPGATPLSTGPATAQAKASSFSIRLGLLEATLRMIRENPMGVGSGNYADQFVPYLSRGRLVPDESLLYASPHNEYLRVVAEEGWVFALLVAGVLAVFLRQLHRSSAIDRWRSDQGILLGSMIVFYAVEGAFQFPLSMAVGSMMAAFIAGLGLRCLSRPPDAVGTSAVPRSRDRAVTAGWLIAASAAGVALYRMAASEYLFVHSQRRVDLERACRLNARNTEACVLAAWTQIQAGDDPAARRSLAAVLKHFPYYYPAIKLLAENAFARGETGEGCLYFWIYDGLFRGASTLHGVLVERCPAGVLDGFRNRVPMPRYGEFPFVYREPGSPGGAGIDGVPGTTGIDGVCGNCGAVGLKGVGLKAGLKGAGLTGAGLTGTALKTGGTSSGTNGSGSSGSARFGTSSASGTTRRGLSLRSAGSNVRDWLAAPDVGVVDTMSVCTRSPFSIVRP